MFCRVEDHTKVGTSEKVKRTLHMHLEPYKGKRKGERVYRDISTKKYTKSFQKLLFSAAALNLMQRERGKDKDFLKP